LTEKENSDMIIQIVLWDCYTVPYFCFEKRRFMEEFRTVTYEVHNPKIKKSVRFAVLADLHGSIFGEEKY